MFCDKIIGQLNDGSTVVGTDEKPVVGLGDAMELWWNEVGEVQTGKELSGAAQERTRNKIKDMLTHREGWQIIGVHVKCRDKTLPGFRGPGFEADERGHAAIDPDAPTVATTEPEQDTTS